MAYLRDRRAFGNIGTRKFRGARFGDPLSPRGPQYTKEGLILDYSTDVGPFTIIDQSGQDNTATLYSGRGLTMDGVSDLIDFGSPTFSEPVTSMTGYARSTDTSINLGLTEATLAGNDTWETFSADTLAKNYGDAQWFNGVDTKVSVAAPLTAYPYTLEATIVTTGVNGVILWLGDTSVISHYSRIGVDANGKAIIISKDGGVNTSAVSTTSVNDGSPHVIKGIFTSATNRELYVDGVLEATDTVAITPTGIDAFALGLTADSTPALYFDGLILNASLSDGSSSVLNYTGRGATPWKDTIGTNDGTVSGVDQTATEYFTNPDFILGTGYNGDLSDIRCLGATGTVLGHWTLADWSDPAGNTSNGKTIVDSGPNGYHGVCTGCSGFTGEATIPQTADRNWNKYQWFNGVDTEINIGNVLNIGTSDFRIKTKVLYMGGAVNYKVVDKRENAGGADGYSLFIRSTGTVGAALGASSPVTYSTSSTTTLVANTVYVIEAIYDRSGNLSLSIDGSVEDTVNISAESGFNVTNARALRIGAGSASGADMAEQFIFGHIFYTEIDVGNTGEADSRWEAPDLSIDTIGSNDGTESGTFTRELVSASDANDQIDALGNAILEPRRNTQQLNLFGEGEYSSTPDSDSLDVTTEATWEIWGNFYGVPSTTGALIGKHDSGASKRSFLLSNHPADNADQVRLISSSDGTSANLSRIEGMPDEVIQLVVTHSGSTWVAYINGVSTSISGATPATSLFVNDIPYEIGYNAGSNLPYTGKIGSAKIYNRALTADEVLTNYESQKSLYLNVFPFTLT